MIIFKFKKRLSALLLVMVVVSFCSVILNSRGFAQVKDEAQEGEIEPGEEAVVEGFAHKQSIETIQNEMQLTRQIPPIGEIKLDFPIYGINFSNDGKFLVTADKTGGIRLWDVEKNYSLADTLEGHTKEVYGLDISVDGKYLASGGADQLIKIWDLTTRKLVKTIRDYTGTVSSLAFSPDNSILASANLRNVIEFWAVEDESFQYVTTLTGQKSSIYCLDFYPNGEYLASGGKDKEIRIWPLGVEDKIKILTEHTHLVLDVAFSPKGNFFASGGADNMAYLWKTAIEKGKLQFSKSPFIAYAHRGWVTKVGFSPDERFFLTGSQYGQVHIWDTFNTSLLKIISVFPDEPIFDFSFSMDGKYLAVAGKSGSVSIYDWPAITSKSHGVVGNSNLKLKNSDSFPAVPEDSRL